MRLCLCLLSLLLLSGVASAFPLRVVGNAYIIDGDTLQIQSHKIRLTGIDAPELTQTCQSPDKRLWACGQHAKRYLEQITHNQPITCTITTKDRYNRFLGRCRAHNEDLGSLLVQNGWAIAYGGSTGLYYRLLELKARFGGKNIWSGSFISPKEWRKR